MSTTVAIAPEVHEQQCPGLFYVARANELYSFVRELGGEIDRTMRFMSPLLTTR
jgi:hypothetical protein